MKIAFTSCMDAVRVPDQPVWASIQNGFPDLDVLMLLGDQIYMDWGLSLGKPKWRSRIEKKNGLQAFAQEMHMRYARQWAVSGFRELIRWFVPLRGHDQLFVCWDDHDFAWNNACGGGLDPKYSVPLAVREVSHRLFNQFVNQLKFDYGRDDYPAFDQHYAMSSPVADSGVQAFAPTPIGGVAIAVLDERYYRVHRNEMKPSQKVPQLLGAEQMGELSKLLGRRPLITVLAGGVPLAHKYANSADGWSGADNGETDYPDLQMLLDGADSAVLYLAGDIHENEWGGLVRKSNGKPSQVVQVAASAAARGRLLLHRFAPSFGVADIDVVRRTAKVSLCSLDKKGALVNPGPVELRFDAAGWTNPENIPPRQGGPAHTVQPMTEIANQDDLAIICFRARSRDESWDALGADEYNVSDIESLYEDELPPGGQAAFPDAVEVSVGRQRVSVREGSQEALTEVCLKAFRRAAPLKRTVTLFVHGFDKGFAESVDQGFGLRDRYPDVEPVVFSWPGGFVRHGFLDAGYEFRHGMDISEEVASGLYTALACFKAAQQEFLREEPGASAKATLLVRSLGAMVMRHLLWSRHGGQAEGKFTQNAADAKLFSGFDAVVFSAPVLDLAYHGKTLENLGVPAFVSINRHDKALRLSKLFSLDALGCALPVTGDKKARPGSNAQYLDCSDFDAIADHHNYIIDPWNADVVAAHAQVLVGTWQPAQLGAWCNRGGSIWGKK